MGTRNDWKEDAGPFAAQAAAVLQVAGEIDAADTRLGADIEGGLSVSDLMARKHK